MLREQIISILYFQASRNDGNIIIFVGWTIVVPLCWLLVGAFLNERVNELFVILERKAHCGHTIELKHHVFHYYI